MKIKDYDEWLTMNDDAQYKESLTWDVYAREGYGLAMHATGRLILSCNFDVFDSDAVVYQGKWMILVTLSQSTFMKFQEDLASSFEGFFVGWRIEPTLGPEKGDGAH